MSEVEGITEIAFMMISSLRMKSAVQVGATDSPPGDVVEDWENDEASESMEKQLTERFKQIRILQRAQADKEARKEKAVRCQEEARLNPCFLSTPLVTPAGPGGAPPAPVRILRRPESSDKIREENFRAQRAKAEEAARNQLTPEQKEALYVKARDRIMGPEYKPDNSQNAQNVAIVSRCKSPEQIRVPRFTDLPLAGTMSGPSHDASLGGPMIMSSINTVSGVTSPTAVGAPIVATQQSTQQKPTSLLTMSSSPVGMSVQQATAIAQGLSQQVIGQQQACMVSSPPPPQSITAYPQYVIAQPQQHMPYTMAVGSNQSMVPFIDTTRPPPAVTIPSITGHVNPPQVATGVPLSLPQVGRGAPVMSIYPPGSLTAALRGDSGGVPTVSVCNSQQTKKGRRSRNKRDN
ncbi:hypothetical protein DICVIV_02600 [Dictyocaulus viviparus]|uniref:SUZ domain-containing protein n=1 Tax=Dictyocaulus viviparus TaxID=29172 RepID=A0A0D8Y3G2_DICVI|nr:hypothetical protein DICVIV_02600 [Dictyocaulus viviparus]